MHYRRMHCGKSLHRSFLLAHVREREDNPTRIARE